MRKRHDVFHFLIVQSKMLRETEGSRVLTESMSAASSGGKSEPASTIQETVLVRGTGENRRAPNAE